METLTWMRVPLLFISTAVAEIGGCYLVYLWLRKDGSAWLLIPGALCLALFAWLFTLHPHAAGRVYAAYGGVYVAMALLWLWLVEGNTPDRWDLIGAAVDGRRHGDHHVRPPRVSLLNPTQRRRERREKQGEN